MGFFGKKNYTTPSIDTHLVDLMEYWVYRSGKATVSAADDLDNINII